MPATIYNFNIFSSYIKKVKRGNSLVVQWLGLFAFSAFTAEGLGSIPGRGTKILQAT